MDIKAVLIHGNGGATAEDIWFPYLRKQLETLKISVIAQTFPDNKLARQSVWLPYLEKTLHADKNTILIGHSSGAVAAMRYAEQHEIFGSVLISAYHSDLHLPSEKASGYFDSAWDWKRIKNNQNWVIQFASTDDPFIPIAEAQFIHEVLQTEYHEYSTMGHFVRWDNEIKKLPDTIVSILKTKIQN